MRAKLLLVSFLALSMSACVSSRPHSVVVTPHFERVKEKNKAFFAGQGKACGTTVLWMFHSGDRTLQAAMPSVNPAYGGSLAYITIDEEVGNYFLWTKTCTIVNAYYAKPLPTPKQASPSTEKRAGDPAPQFSNYIRPPDFNKYIPFTEGVDQTVLDELTKLVGKDIWIKTTTGRGYLGTLQWIKGTLIKVSDDMESGDIIVLDDVSVVAYK